MAEPSLFRHYQIVQDADGNNVELIRSAEQVAVLAFDSERLEFVHCHVVLDPLKNKAAFDEGCRALQRNGHPLLAAVTDFGEDDSNAFYITSNVDGETLRGYLSRQSELPLWLAAMLTVRALDAAIELVQRVDAMPDQPLDSFRVVQISASQLAVLAADYRLQDPQGRSKSRVIKANFERQAKFMRTFLKEQGGGPGPTLPDAMLSAVDFAELLSSTLAAGGPGLGDIMAELRKSLLKIVPEHLAAEIPTALKPRALVAPLLASYQEVARGVVNLVRIQSQRLDMANPYCMRGTLTRTGRAVQVEQVPPARLCTKGVIEADRASQKLGRKRDANALLGVPLVHEAETLACIAEEIAEGFSLAEVLRERGALGVAEVYLLLAGIDSALGQVERSDLPTKKLRLEDVFLLTGFGRDDARGSRLLTTRLNEWPSFNVMLRAHPTLGAMACRGTNIASALPPPAGKASPWHGGWMACLGRLLLTEGTGAPDATREATASLFEEEIIRAREEVAVSRADVLARFARIIQHYDVVAPPPLSTIAKASPKAAPTTAPLSPIAASLGGAQEPMAAPTGEESSIGFAELLFQGGSATRDDAGVRTEVQAWGQGASEDFATGEVGGWDADADPSPWWLKAAVFIGGSMVAGAFFAQISGHAIWHERPAPPPIVAPAR